MPYPTTIFIGTNRSNVVDTETIMAVVGAVVGHSKFNVLG
jgi:hypothetical protein